MRNTQGLEGCAMTVWEKLQLKAAGRLLIVEAPAEFDGALAELPAERRVDRVAEPGISYPLALVFVQCADDVRRHAGAAVAALVDDGLLWFAYAKKSSRRYNAELSRDEGWAALGALGYEPVRQIAIDSDWSAVRFRHASRIQRLTRTKVRRLSAEGQARGVEASVEAPSDGSA